MKSNPETSTAPAPKSRRAITRLFWRIFWLSFLILSLAYAWYSFYAPSNDVAWCSGFTEAEEMAAGTDKPMILFFTATWCSPCRMMKRTIWADRQVAAEVNEQFIPLMLNADDPAMTALFSRYNVNATPVTIITDPQGNVLDWVAGKVGKQDFLNFIRKQYRNNR